MYKRELLWIKERCSEEKYSNVCQTVSTSMLMNAQQIFDVINLTDNLLYCHVVCPSSPLETIGYNVSQFGASGISSNISGKQPESFHLLIHSPKNQGHHPGLAHGRQGCQHSSRHLLPSELCISRGWGQARSQDLNPSSLMWDVCKYLPP